MITVLAIYMIYKWKMGMIDRDINISNVEIKIFWSSKFVLDVVSFFSSRHKIYFEHKIQYIYGMWERCFFVFLLQLV